MSHTTEEVIQQVQQQQAYAQAELERVNAEWEQAARSGDEESIMALEDEQDALNKSLKRFALRLEHLAEQQQEEAEQLRLDRITAINAELVADASSLAGKLAKLDAQREKLIQQIQEARQDAVAMQSAVSELAAMLPDTCEAEDALRQFAEPAFDAVGLDGLNLSAHARTLRESMSGVYRLAHAIRFESYSRRQDEQRKAG